jgi:hypothetical protein
MNPPGRDDSAKDCGIRKFGGGIDAAALHLNNAAVGIMNLPMRVAQLVLIFSVLAISSPSVRGQIFPVWNDDFANAAKLRSAGEKVIANNQLATMEALEPRHAGVASVERSLWWSFSPAKEGPVLVDTTGSGFDTVLGVYRGSGLGNLTEVASTNNVAGQLQAHLKFPASAGVTYYIAVAGSDMTQFGEVRLRVEPGGEPDQTRPEIAIRSHASGMTVYTNQIVLSGVALDPAPNASGIQEIVVTVNGIFAGQPVSGTSAWSVPILLMAGENRIEAVAVDFAGNRSVISSVKLRMQVAGPVNGFFAQALMLEEESGVITWNSFGATKEFGEPDHAENEGGSSVWWNWVAPEDGILFLSTAGSGFDTLLGLYRGNRVGNLEWVASNDDMASGGEHSEVTTAVQGGLMYRVAVDGFGGASGLIQLRYGFTAVAIHALQVVSTPGGISTPGSGQYPGNSTVMLSATADPYFEFAAWEWPDGAVLSQQNPWALQMDRAMNLVARFVPRLFTEDFESGRLDRGKWSDGGHWGWQVQSFEKAHGNFAARSGPVGHGQTSSLILTGQMQPGPGSFEFKVSSETNWDQLEFFVNGVRRGGWSGETGWQRHSFSVPAGLNRLEWRYSKDHAIDGGLDGAFIDNIDVPLAAVGGAAPRLSLASLKVEEGRLVEVRGEPRQQYILHVSSDLLSWRSISTNRSNSSGYLLFNDPEAVSGKARFYRVLVP